MMAEGRDIIVWNLSWDESAVTYSVLFQHESFFRKLPLNLNTSLSQHEIKQKLSINHSSYYHRIANSLSI